MNKSDNIFLFSKTSYPGVNHVPILQVNYLQPSIDFSFFDYIIATSKEIFTALDQIGSWKHLPVLAISDSTAQVALQKGAKILDIADGYGKDIVALIKAKYSDLKALHPHAKVVAFDIEEALKENDVSINSFTVYETSCSQTKLPALPLDAICIFTSPSSVRCFLKSYQFLPTYQVVCIGETTASQLPEGINFVISETTSVPSTIERAESLVK